MKKVEFKGIDFPQDLLNKYSIWKDDKVGILVDCEIIIPSDAGPFKLNDNLTTWELEFSYGYIIFPKLKGSLTVGFWSPERVLDRLTK